MYVRRGRQVLAIMHGVMMLRGRRFLQWAADRLRRVMHRRRAGNLRGRSPSLHRQCQRKQPQQCRLDDAIHAKKCTGASLFRQRYFK